MCAHSSESYRAVLSSGAVSNDNSRWLELSILWKKSSSLPIQVRASERYFPVDIFVLSLSVQPLSYMIS